MATAIILNTDGRFSSLGHYADEAAIEAASAAMVAAGLSGWVCEMRGQYYGRGKVTLAQVGTIGAPGDFAAAEAAFHAARAATAQR